MTTLSTSVVYIIDEEHKRKVNEISALVLERIERGMEGGITDLPKSIEALNDILDRVKTDCTADLHHRAREHSAAALINRRLPPEILTEIILYAIGSEGYQYYTRLYDLRSVSKYWNSVIESTPSIWAVLDCTAIEYSGCSSWTNFIKIAIKQSGALPIHVTGHAVSSDNTQFDLLLGASSRWHDADLTLRTNRILDFISHESFPNLVTLSVREYAGPDEIDEIDHCIRPCGSFPSLQRLRTDAVLLRPPEGFAALMILIIEPTPSDEIFVIPCFTLPTYLICCPNLRELRIANVWGYDAWRPEEAKRLEVRLPHLHTLTIWDCDLGLMGSLLLALKGHSCEKLFIKLESYLTSCADEWREWRRGCDVPELLDHFVPLIQGSCKESNSVELVLAPDQFRLRTHTSGSDTAGASQSIVVDLADVAKPQSAEALLDLLGLENRTPPFEVHLRVQIRSDPRSDRVHQFREKILRPVLGWPSITSLSVDMDERNAQVFFEELRKPLRSGLWPLPNVTTLFLDMDIGALDEELRLLYKRRLGEDDGIAPLQSIVISSRTAWGGTILSKGLEDVPSDVFMERHPEEKASWKDSLPWTTF